MPQVDRRDFLKIVGAGAGAAATAGCSDPVEKLIPYVVQPEEITPGIPVTYASTCRECPTGCGIHVKTREGRPIKLEGNPEHPINQGALCARGQASIGRTYHPDRYAGPQRRGPDGSAAAVSWDDAIAEVAKRVAEAGSGTYLLGADPGPTAAAVIDGFVSAVGAGGRVLYEPFEPEALREAARASLGVDALPLFDLSGADLILDFGSDFLESGDAVTEHARQFADARDVSQNAAGGARLVSVTPRLSMTASSADEWVAAVPGSEGILALAIARAAMDAGAGAGQAGLRGLLSGYDAASAAEKTGISPETIKRLGAGAAAAKAPVALPPGVSVRSRRATATAGAVLVLNAVLGAIGRGVKLPEGTGRKGASYREVLTLVEAMKSGKVKVLLIHDANPVYSLPAAVGFAEALEKVDTVVSFAALADETSERAHWVLPDHTALEAWGDAQPRPGVRSLQQPTVRPLHDTRALADTLLDVGRAAGAGDSLPAGSFRTLVEQAWAGEDFRAALARGGSFAESVGTSTPSASGTGRYEVAEPLLEGDGDLVLLPFATAMFGDGRSAALPWMQELGDPTTKVAWQPWAELSNATAERLDVVYGDVIAIETTAGRIEVPAFPRGGIRDDVVAVPIGQGHSVGHYASMADNGAPGVARGANVIAALPSATDENGGRAWLTAKATVSKTGRFERLPMVQASDNKRGRMLGEVITLSALAAAAQPPHVSAHHEEAEAEGHGQEHGGGDGGHHEILLDYDMADDAVEGSPYRWGMTIDLDRCTGCNACVAACYTENAIPLVGEEYTRRSRTMSWIRIERYVGEGDTSGGSARQLRPDSEVQGDSDVRFSPMLCQHCGAAPCESVCPVLATYHNDEGMNGMIYNRCVGTRYCSNNCPYKVRRFNYRDYARERWPGMLHLMANPDVTLRQQGVMEKCSFCIQRIQAARQPAKDEGRAIRDGEVVTACQQSCPSHAIGFGNLRDKGSRVSKQAEDPRGYKALHVLNTRPAITYLKKVKRGPVEV